VVIIIGREFTVLGLRNIASAEGFTIEASALGKTKMVLQVCAVAVLIAGARRPSLTHWLCFCSGSWLSARWSPPRNIFLRFWGHVDDRIKQRRKLRHARSRKKSWRCGSLSDTDRQSLLRLPAWR